MSELNVRKTPKLMVWNVAGEINLNLRKINMLCKTISFLLLLLGQFENKSTAHYFI